MIPYRIETLPQYTPWANRALFAATIATSLAIETGVIPDEVAAKYFVLTAEVPVSFIGHLFAHGGLGHLAGNMLFLWVFGDAVCASVGNLRYLLIYLVCGAGAGAVHAALDGAPAVGASGAIAGIVGLAVALYPINRVSLAVFLVGFLARSFQLPLWGIALYWTAWDLLGAYLDLPGVAYWAHIGGTGLGVAIGLLLLALRQVEFSDCDNGSLLDFMLRRAPEHKRAVQPDFAAPIAAVESAFELKAEVPFGSRTPASPVARLRLPTGTPAAGHAHPAASTLSGQAGPQTEAPGPRRSLPLLRTRMVPSSAEAPTPSPPPGEGRPLSAWPDALPEGNYFYFDGEARSGPVSRGDFLARLAATADTARWWYWTGGMPEWKPVAELNRPAKPQRPL